ncbi:MAG TPA: LarC family nickel insertion protein, partial [Acidobacteriaceae bacterium]|nr:LarC family nickel insertion protein [Acidobacteriaceae bacterium]
MKVAKLECFAGISGDMMLGALIDAGVPEVLLQEAARSLGIGAELRVGSVVRNGIRATKVDVLEHGRLAEDADEHGDAQHDHAHQHEHHDEHQHAHSRNWPQIRELIEGAAIQEQAKRIALRAFELLAVAEAKVHGISPEQVHFHEVGAVDTITDIVCAAVGVASLRVDEWRCSAVNVGSGFVQCAHGQMPVPAPATAELLQGVPTYAAGPQMELTTPTGAALLRALGCRFDAKDPVTESGNGYGAGGRDPKGFP